MPALAERLQLGEQRRLRLTASRRRGRGRVVALRLVEAFDGEAQRRAQRTVPATFSLHTGFDDPATPPGAPERESIEVRLVAFFE